MKMKNTTYNYMKWIVLVVLPAAAVLIATIGGEVNWEYTQVTVTVLNAVTAFLGTSLGVSSINYQKGGNEDV